MKLHFDWFIGNGHFPSVVPTCAQAYEDNNIDADLRDGEYVRMPSSTYEDTVDHGTVCHKCGKRASTLQAPRLTKPRSMMDTMAQNPDGDLYGQYFSRLTVSK